MRPPPTIGCRRQHVFRSSVQPSGRPLFIRCPFVSNYFAWSNISELRGRISMKLVKYSSCECALLKRFQGQSSKVKVKVIARWNALIPPHFSVRGYPSTNGRPSVVRVAEAYISTVRRRGLLVNNSISAQLLSGKSYISQTDTETETVSSESVVYCDWDTGLQIQLNPVSYTHLTLPTKRIV